MNTIHTIKICRPDEDETTAMWDLYHAAEAVEDRWSRRSTVKDLMYRLRDGELTRNDRRFIMRAWSVLVDGNGGFGRFMSTFSAMIATFQDPAVDYVQAKPELEQMAADAELLPVYEEAYKQAIANPDSEIVARCLAGEVIQLAVKHVIETMKLEQGGV